MKTENMSATTYTHKKYTLRKDEEKGSDKLESHS